MKRTTTIYHASAFIILFLFSQKTFSQQGNITVYQDSKFEQLLNEKRKINSSITINDRYKVQIYNGENEGARKILSDFKKEYKNIDATIMFSTPAYKIWVGNFKTKIEAENNLIELKKKYPNAFLIKPNK